MKRSTHLGAPYHRGAAHPDYMFRPWVMILPLAATGRVGPHTPV